jgi:hypothetical protein
LIGALALASCSGLDATYGTGAAVVASVQVAPGSAAMTIGATLQLTATPRDADGNMLFSEPVQWSTASESVATVDSAGLVTGRGAGTTVISATARGTSGAAGVVVAIPGVAMFEDDFESGATRGPQNGFAWTSTTGVAVSAARAYSGTYSLKFSYGPDAQGQDSWAEQRFVLGGYLSELWVEYYLHVPSNYYHRNDVSSDNNKFLSIWRDQYGSGNGDLIAGYETELASTAGNSQLRSYSTRPDTYTVSNLVNPQVSRGDPLISDTGPITRGAWTRIRLHVKTASGPNVSDGVMEFWAGATQVLQKVDGAFWYPATLAGGDPNPLFDDPTCTLHNGYIFGWSNSGFTELTEFFVDAVKFYATNPGWVGQ